MNQTIVIINGIKSDDETRIPVEDTSQTLADISKENSVPPQQIYLTMKPKVIPAGKAIKLPDSPPPRTGNMILADLCA